MRDVDYMNGADVHLVEVLQKWINETELEVGDHVISCTGELATVDSVIRHYGERDRVVVKWHKNNEFSTRLYHRAFTKIPNFLREATKYA